jgi:threonine aldolase
VQSPDTNVVNVDSSGAELTAEAFVDRCAEAGVAAGAHGTYTTRFCTHLDVDREDIEEAVGRIERALRTD